MGRLRVASLLPSTTEIVCALGFQHTLVARSHECDFPAGVEALPACTEPQFDTSGSSADIDARVRELVERGLSIYRVDAEQLRELRPDVILTQDQCEVCAASLKDVEAAVAEWLDQDAKVVSLRPNSLSDVFADFIRVAAALGAPNQGERLCDELTERVRRVSEQTSRLRDRPSVASIEWIDPLMTAGHWMPELVTLAGGRILFSQAGEKSVGADWQALHDADPDRVVVLPCGFDLERTRQEMKYLMAKPGYAELSAVRNGHVYLMDGNQFFNRPGPRLVDSLEIMAEVLHPDNFPARHEGVAWSRQKRLGAKA